MGCCSCCWIGNKLFVDVGLGQQANLNRAALGSSCDGCCANRCRRSGRHSEGSGPPQAAAGRRVLGSSGSTGSFGHGVAHAHLSRLISAAGGSVSPPPGSAGTSSTSSSASEQDRRQQNNPPVSKPRPRRFVSSTSHIARQHPRLLSLLAGLLQFDPDERLTPLQALAHPFFGEAFPFAALPQATQAAAAEHPRKAMPVKPATTNLAKEQGEGGSAAASAQRRTSNSVATPTPAAGVTRLPRSPAFARPSSRQQEPSPSLCYNGSAGAGNARRQAASTGTSRPHANKRSLDAPGVAAAPVAARSLSSRPGAASGNDNGTPHPSREVDSSSSSSSSNASREMDPTAQLRRLAEMAGAMVSKGSNRYSRGRDSSSSSSSGSGSGTGGGGSDSSSTAPMPSPRRNPFLNAELLARLKREDPSEPRKPGVSGARTGRRQQQQHQADDSLSKTPPASQRRPNPFLSPATLAILNPGLGVRKEAGEAAAVAAPTAVAAAVASKGGRGQAAVERSNWDGRRVPTAKTAIATPTARAYTAKRDKVAPSPTRAATRAVAAIQPKAHRGGLGKEEGKKERNGPTPCEKREPGTSTTTKRKRGRRSPRAADNNTNGATPSRAREEGRMTTPRRAAVAAGVAILRLRDDDESSDGSLTL